MSDPIHDDERLRRLLRAADRPPAELAAALAAERHAAAGTLPVARELDRAEQQFLVALGRDRPEVQPDLAALRRAALRYEVACLGTAATDDVDAPYELAERCAEAGWLGLPDVVADCRAQLQRRIAAAPACPAQRSEAEERYATLATAEEDLELGHRLLLLRETAAVMTGLAATTGERRAARLARRLHAAADDRELALRVEQRLGHRGARWLETTSFLLLLLVLTLILIDALTPGPAPAAGVFLWIDAVACFCFIAEFVFKLTLAPRRWHWFLRNAVTDLLPSIPAVLLLMPITSLPGEVGDVAAVRLLRLFRITWAARYVQALRPLLRSFRLLTFLVRGMDGLVDRFSSQLNRDFVFFGGDAVVTSRAARAAGAARELLFKALRREHELVRALPPAQADAVVAARARLLAERLQTMPPRWLRVMADDHNGREMAVEAAVDWLWSLRPEDVGHHLARHQVLALDRAVRVISAPVVRWLPLARRLSLRPLPATPEQRIVALGHRVADWLHGWQLRLQFFADLQGIVTGPQILDSVATAMVKASQRPAVRLLFFGGLFMLFDLLIHNEAISGFFQRIVVGPLLILGSVCLFFLGVGWWLKRVAGEAGDRFKMTSEAQFVSLLHLQKRRHADADLRFLAGRVFGDDGGDDGGDAAATALSRQYAARTSDVPEVGGPLPPHVARGISRVALLYEHFLDGALLHQSDIKTSEQLLANLSLDNVRYGWLGQSRRDKKRLRRLRLDDGSLLTGPYLWFRCITASVAVETSKRIAEYNRRCLTLTEQAEAAPAALDAMRAWLRKRTDKRAGRTLERLPPPGRGAVFRTTEFHALDFLVGDPARDEHLASVFGQEVVAALRQDRATMIREIFGTRPVHLLPRHERSFNAYRFYRQRLSRGRALLLPLYAVYGSLRSIGWIVGKVRSVVREVLSPHRAQQLRSSGRATFATALRKINRMKAPGLLEAIRLRLGCDPLYCGAPATWSLGGSYAETSALRADLAFLQLPARERNELRAAAGAARAAVQQLHSRLPVLPDFAAERPDVEPAAGQLGVTVAWLTDQDDVRTLAGSGEWLAAASAAVAAGLPGSRLGDAVRALRAASFGSPVDAWLHAMAPAATPAVRRQWRRLHAADAATARTVAAWLRLGDQRPEVAVRDRLLAAYGRGPQVRSDLYALRTVQSLSVIDVRDYRDLVFRLGAYAEDGEDAGRMLRLP